MRFFSIKQMPLVIGILVLGRKSSTEACFIHRRTTHKDCWDTWENFDANAHTMTSHIQPCAYGQITDLLNHSRYFCSLDGQRGFLFKNFFHEARRERERTNAEEI